MNDNQALLIYPNPGNGKIKVVLNNYKGAVHFIACNSIGQVVYTREAVIGYSIPQSLDFSMLSKGTYYLTAQTNNGYFVKNFFIE